MGEFIRDRLPDPLSFYEEQLGMKLGGRGKWRTTSCEFHGGSDSMRVNVESGGWCCMNCGMKGGDVLAYYMARHGLDFVESAKALNAWDARGQSSQPNKPRALSARQALQVLLFEATLVAVAAGNIAHGKKLSDVDHIRLMIAVERINRLVDDFV